MKRVTIIAIRVLHYEKLRIELLAKQSKFNTTAGYCRAVLLGQEFNRKIDHKQAALLMKINDLLHSDNDYFTKNHLREMKQILHDSC